VPIIATSPEPRAAARLGQMATLSPRRLAEQPLRSPCPAAGHGAHRYSIQCSSNRAGVVFRRRQERFSERLGSVPVSGPGNHDRIFKLLVIVLFTERRPGNRAWRPFRRRTRLACRVGASEEIRCREYARAAGRPGSDGLGVRNHVTVTAGPLLRAGGGRRP
jgi:hypothetical protein